MTLEKCYQVNFETLFQHQKMDRLVQQGQRWATVSLWAPFFWSVRCSIHSTLAFVFAVLALYFYLLSMYQAMALLLACSTCERHFAVNFVGYNREFDAYARNDPLMTAGIALFNKRVLNDGETNRIALIVLVTISTASRMQISYCYLSILFGWTMFVVVEMFPVRKYQQTIDPTPLAHASYITVRLLSTFAIVASTMYCF